jgi:hypothetical protein
MKRSCALIAPALVLAAATSALAAPPKKAPKAPPVQGFLTDLNKDKTRDLGSITVKVKGSSLTFVVTEKTRFQFYDGVSTWGANFLDDQLGKKVNVYARAGSNPAEAAVVQFVLPPPPPRRPGPPPPQRPARVFGVVTEVAAGHLTIRLPNRTPPPPVTGAVSDLGLDKASGYASITVSSGGKARKFWVNSGTTFLTLGARHRHWQVSFLSITDGETVKVFPRYGAPHLAGAVDILLKGSKAPPAIRYKDHFLKFELRPGTRYVLVRNGRQRGVPRSALAAGEDVGVMPHGLHSHVADNVHIQAPGDLHGQLVSAGGSGLSVKVRYHGKGKKTGHVKTVAVTGSTRYQTVRGKAVQPASRSALKPGQHLVIHFAAPAPHPAEAVEIHLRPPPHPQTFHGTVVSAGGGKLTVKVKGGNRQFILDGSTKVQAHEGKKHRAARPGELKAGARVAVVALNQPPHQAQHVDIEIASKAKPKPKPKDKPKPKGTVKPPPPPPKKKKK